MSFPRRPWPINGHSAGLWHSCHLTSSVFHMMWSKYGFILCIPEPHNSSVECRNYLAFIYIYCALTSDIFRLGVGVGGGGAGVRASLFAERIIFS